jgi:signal transduction histidine kinase
MISKPDYHTDDFLFMVNNSRSASQLFLTFKLHNFVFNNENCQMIVMKDNTESLSLGYLKIMNEMMRILQASVSHDMRAPLQSISTVIELVL